MATKRSGFLGTLALLTLVATGCGRTGALPTVQAPQMAGVHANAITVNGQTHVLGYDFKRYEQLFAPSARKAHLVRQGALPASVDNRQFDAPIYDQGQLGSCTAFSMGKGLREFMQRKNGETQTPLSAMWFYFRERVDQKTVNQDSGATIHEGMDVLKNQGVAPDADWAYDITKFKLKPPAKADADASAWKVHATTQLAGVDDAKTAIANGHSVSIGFTVYQSFRSIGADGLMPVPKNGESVLGGHAVELVGYDDARQVFTVRNSWNTTWGDKGYFYMPYAFVSGSVDGQANVDEIWTAD